jgi:hypothetical protein
MKDIESIRKIRSGFEDAAGGVDAAFGDVVRGGKVVV